MKKHRKLSILSVCFLWLARPFIVKENPIMVTKASNDDCHDIVVSTDSDEDKCVECGNLVTV